MTRRLIDLRAPDLRRGGVEVAFDDSTTATAWAVEDPRVSPIPGLTIPLRRRPKRPPEIRVWGGESAVPESKKFQSELAADTEPNDEDGHPAKNGVGSWDWLDEFGVASAVAQIPDGRVQEIFSTIREYRRELERIQDPYIHWMLEALGSTTWSVHPASVFRRDVHPKGPDMADRGERLRSDQHPSAEGGCSESILGDDNADPICDPSYDQPWRRVGVVRGPNGNRGTGALFGNCLVSTAVHVLANNDPCDPCNLDGSSMSFMPEICGIDAFLEDLFFWIQPCSFCAPIMVPSQRFFDWIADQTLLALNGAPFFPLFVDVPNGWISAPDGGKSRMEASEDVAAMALDFDIGNYFGTFGWREIKKKNEYAVYLIGVRGPVGDDLPFQLVGGMGTEFQRQPVLEYDLWKYPNGWWCLDHVFDTVGGVSGAPIVVNTVWQKIVAIHNSSGDSNENWGACGPSLASWMSEVKASLDVPDVF